ncbi:MAG: O-antigen ligase family protein [Endomicrobia bacterium]|nr:O-antigen ligase family protein [Endomicrobiia bacterium]
MENKNEKFNYLVLILALGLILSVFSQFLMTPGIYYGVFLLYFSTFFLVFVKYKCNLDKFYLPVFLFLGFAGFLYYISDFQYNLRFGVLLLSASVSAYFLSACMNEYEKRSVMLIPVLIGLWLTIYLFASYFAVSAHPEPGALTKYMTRVSGFLVAVLPLSFAFWRSDRKIYYFTSFMIFFAVIMAKSDWAALIACLIFAVFLFFARESIKYRAIFTVTPFLAGAGFFLYKLFQNSFFSVKFTLWQTAADIIKSNPIFGVGLGNYENVSLFYSTTENFDVSSAGNMFLQLIAETGIIGFTLFLCIVFVFFYFIIKKLKNTEEKVLPFNVLIAVCAVLMFNFFETSLFYLTNLVVFFILLAYPLDVIDLKPRVKQLSVYVTIPLLAALIFCAAKPMYAYRQYKTGLSFFAAQKYVVAMDSYFVAIQNDAINPEYSSRLADTYFAMYQQNDNLVSLYNAIGFAERASKLNRYNGRYYYQLAWLYHFKGDKEAAFANIEKAIRADRFNRIYQNAYGEFL